MAETLKLGKFCVYTHRSKGEVFYVGMGNSSRPYTCRGRPRRWKEIVGDSGSYDVEITAWFESEGLARIEEKRMIEAYRPYANKVHNESNSFDGRLFMRISEEEINRLKEESKKSGVSVSEFVRMALELEYVRTRCEPDLSRLPMEDLIEGVDLGEL